MHKISYILFLLIILLAAFLRLYRISEYMTFLGDEGRDVLVAKRMIVDRKFTLLGPITSVGSIYMGPAYYYLMTPFLLIWGMDPVGPSVMVALFAVATVALIYKFCREFINPYAGIISAFLYATSPLTIIYGRSSWNPNVVPFFGLAVIYGLAKTVVKGQFRWLAASGLALGILLQLHYVTLLFIPVIAACLALIRFKIPRKYYFYAALTFLLTYSPRHLSSIYFHIPDSLDGQPF